MFMKYWRIQSRKKRKVLIVFDDVIAGMISNKKLNPIVTELFTRDRKRKVSVVLTTQTYFKVPKDVRLNSTHFLLWKFKIKNNFNKLQ